MFSNHYSSLSFYHQDPIHFSNHQFLPSTSYSIFVTQDFNMNTNVTMNPPQSLSIISQKAFYSSNENNTNTLEGIWI
jgi:hypothetical protein